MKKRVEKEEKEEIFLAIPFRASLTEYPSLHHWPTLTHNSVIYYSLKVETTVIEAHGTTTFHPKKRRLHPYRQIFEALRKVNF